MLNKTRRQIAREDKAQKVLYSQFDFDTHNRTFVNYCEVVIFPDGTIKYAIPSHQEMLIAEFCRQSNLPNREAAFKLFYKNPNWIYEMQKVCNLIFVWYEDVATYSTITEKQALALKMLREKGCISRTPIEV